MSFKMKTRVIMASVALVMTTTTGIGVYAQEAQFDASRDSLLPYIRDENGNGICPTLGQEAETSDEQDLFARCGSAVGLDGAAQNDVLDQFLGVQGVAAQSDASKTVQMTNQGVSDRMSIVSGQLRGRMLADASPSTVLLASNDPTNLPLEGTLRGRKLDAFGSIGGFDGSQDGTSSEAGFDYDGIWLTAGVDYALREDVVIGGAVNYADSDGEFDSIGGNDNGGDTSTESWSIAAFGVWLPNEKLELNSMISVGQADYETTRNIAVEDTNADSGEVRRTASGSTSGDTLQFSVGGSYAIETQSAWSVSPYAELNYFKADIDGYSENGAQGLDLTFQDQEIDSLQAKLGASVGRAVSTEWGVVVPYARAAAVFELADDEQSVRAQYTAAQRIAADSFFTITTNPADESSFDLAGGATLITAGGVSGFVEVETVLGLDNVDHIGFSGGIRFEF